MARLTAEQLNASADHGFTLDECEVEVPQLGGTVLLRELLLGERVKLEAKVETNDRGRLKNQIKGLAQTFAAYCAEPKVKPAEAERFLPKWPADVADEVFGGINRLGGPDREVEDKEASAAEAEFPGSEE